jgi:hypothetical protein
MRSALCRLADGMVSKGQRRGALMGNQLALLKAGCMRISASGSRAFSLSRNSTVTIVRLTDSAPEPPPGYRKWDAAEREQLDELLAETEAAVAHRKPGCKGRVAGLVGIERRGFCWPWLVCSGGEVKHSRWLGKALPAVDLA